MFPKNQSLLDAHQVHEVTILAVATSPLDSNSSIGTGSPTSLILESSSLGSPHGTPTVKFAPLPQIDPNRKRCLAPLGVPARLRRKQAIQQERASLLWSTDSDAPEGRMEDPIITFAKFMKKTGKTLWRRVRRNEVLRENVACPAQPVLDISSTVHTAPGAMTVGERGQHVSKAVGGDNGRGPRASWSPLTECRTPIEDEPLRRRSTSDMLRLSVMV